MKDVQESTWQPSPQLKRSNKNTQVTPIHVPALPHNIGFLMKTKMDFRYHADICFVCFKRSHLNGSVFCLYKKRNKAAYSPVSMLKLSQAWRSPPSSGGFLPGKPDQPREWQPLRKRVSGGGTSLALFVVCVVIHVYVRIKERVSGEIRVWRPGKTVLSPFIFKGLCPWIEAKVQHGCVSLAGLAALLRLIDGIVVIMVPLRPEFPPDPLTVHGEVDQLPCSVAEKQELVLRGCGLTVMRSECLCPLESKHHNSNSQGDVRRWDIRRSGRWDEPSWLGLKPPEQGSGSCLLHYVRTQWGGTPSVNWEAGPPRTPALPHHDHGPPNFKYCEEKNGFHLQTTYFVIWRRQEVVSGPPRKFERMKWGKCFSSRKVKISEQAEWEKTSVSYSGQK